MHRLPLILSVVIAVLWGGLRFLGVGDPEPPPLMDPEEAAKAFEGRSTLRCPGTAAQLLAYGQDWYADTTDLSPMVFDSIAADSLSIHGTAHVLFAYRIRQGGHTVEGTKELRYHVTLYATPGLYTLFVDSARIDGRPPTNDTLWVNPPPRPPWFDKEGQRQWAREVDVWSNVCMDVTMELEEMPHRLKEFMLGRVPRPVKPEEVAP